jgi:hypothetical protein
MWKPAQAGARKWRHCEPFGVDAPDERRGPLSELRIGSLTNPGRARRSPSEAKSNGRTDESR